MSTLSISFTVPDEQAARIKNDFSAYHGWKSTVTDAGGNQVSNPETQNAFIKRIIGNFIKESCKSYKAALDAAAARDSAISEVDKNVALA